MDFVALKASIAVGMQFGTHALKALLDDNREIDEVRTSVLANGDMIADSPTIRAGRAAWCSVCSQMARRRIRRGDGAAQVFPS